MSNINTIWKQIRVSDQRSLPGTQKNRKEWITADTWKAIGSRRALRKKVMDIRSERLKARYTQQCREADRAAKRMTRADKRAYMEDLEVKQKRPPTGENKDRCTRSQSLSAASTAWPPTCRLWINREG